MREKKILSLEFVHLTSTDALAVRVAFAPNVTRLNGRRLPGAVVLAVAPDELVGLEPKEAFYVLVNEALEAMRTEIRKYE